MRANGPEYEGYTKRGVMSGRCREPYLFLFSITSACPLDFHISSFIRSEASYRSSFLHVSPGRELCRLTLCYFYGWSQEGSKLLYKETENLRPLLSSPMKQDCRPSHSISK
ncbi:Uncharacterized protein HZ326_28006 [Fusarium oxysporum f. sp. albedinis]|nr:Uncharacterized protein HZ326_28006 [Fusarium oxysporum f. sp. albedinis]